MSKNRKVKKTKNIKSEIWTEEQYEQYIADIYGMEYIAGVTEGGVPYGIPKKDLEVHGENEFNNPTGFDDEVPF